MRTPMNRRMREAVVLFVLGLAIGLLTWPGCGTVPPTPTPAAQITINCAPSSTRTQMAEVTPRLSECVQAQTPVATCVAGLQAEDYTLDALMCAARSRGMQAWRANAEGTGTPGDAIESVALRDYLREQDFRFKN